MLKLEQFKKMEFFKLLKNQYEQNIPKIINGNLEYQNVSQETHVINNLYGQNDALSSIGIPFQQDGQARISTPTGQQSRQCQTKSFVFFDGKITKGCYSWLVPMHPTIEQLVFEKVTFDENPDHGGQVYLTQSPNLKTLVMCNTQNSIELQKLKLAYLICQTTNDFRNIIPKSLQVQTVIVGGVQIKPVQGNSLNRTYTEKIESAKNILQQKTASIAQLQQCLKSILSHVVMNFQDIE